MIWKDVLAIVGGGVLFLIIRCIYLFFRRDWQPVVIFVHPQTGTCLSCERYGDKYRYHINGIRVPKKLYERCWRKQVFYTNLLN
jgi:hypothetical protein